VEDRTATTEWILLELMTGLSRSEQKSDLIRRFAPVVRLGFDAAWWDVAWEHAARLRKRGVSATAADCYIATIALQHDVDLIHCDSDFERIASVLPLRTLDWSKHLPPPSRKTRTEP